MDNDSLSKTKPRRKTKRGDTFRSSRLGVSSRNPLFRSYLVVAVLVGIVSVLLAAVGGGLPKVHGSLVTHNDDGDDEDTNSCRLYLMADEQIEKASDDDDDDMDEFTRQQQQQQQLPKRYRWALYAGEQGFPNPSSTTPSSNNSSRILLFAADLAVTLINANKNEYSPWHDVAWSGERVLPPSWIRTMAAQHYNNSNQVWMGQDVILAGLGALTTCSSGGLRANIRIVPPTPDRNRQTTAHSQLTTTTSFYDIHVDANSDNSPIGFSPKHSIAPGELLVLSCEEDDDDEHEGVLGEEEPTLDSLRYRRTLDELSTRGVCVDGLHVRESTLAGGGAGRGAFSKRAVPKNSVITVSPVLLMDRSQTKILEQQQQRGVRLHSDDGTPKTSNNDNNTSTKPTTMLPLEWLMPLMRDHGIAYTSQTVGTQLLLNYLYGHPDSNAMLLPLAPGVNMINHQNQQPNAYWRWSTHAPFRSIFQNYQTNVPLMELLEESDISLAWDLVALKDISPGEEIFIDYGAAFTDALESFQRSSSGKKSTSDATAPFRHEIGTTLIPSHWMRSDPYPFGDFIASHLGPGQMAPIRWKNGTKVVTPWAFRMGLPERVGQVLMDYCNRMGITDILRHVTVEGNGLEPGTETHLQLNGDDWYLQRPDKEWRSNMHWFSPGSAAAHEDYLQTLSLAGFDEILESVGEHLGMDGLVAYHVTFIGVSFSNRGYLHTDVIETGGKVYNVIIPLLLANETGPELDLQGYREDQPTNTNGEVGRYRYEQNVASMMGDEARHATSACDYRQTMDMRMAATVYIADVNNVNAVSILNHYTQAYPPTDMELLKSWIGRHWKRNDRTRKLPKPSKKHVLRRTKPVQPKMEEL